jgi:hypothetical protein
MISLGFLEKMDRNFAYTIGSNYSVAFLTYIQISHYTDHNFCYLCVMLHWNKRCHIQGAKTAIV